MFFRRQRIAYVQIATMGCLVVNTSLVFSTLKEEPTAVVVLILDEESNAPASTTSNRDSSMRYICCSKQPIGKVLTPATRGTIIEAGGFVAQITRIKVFTPIHTVGMNGLSGNTSHIAATQISLITLKASNIPTIIRFIFAKDDSVIRYCITYYRNDVSYLR